MQEIASHVFIETDFPGVTLGAISWPHGLILIDAPFLPDDIRQWRSSTVALTHSIERLMINLDEHYDRTLGSRQFECAVIGHERMTQLFKDRPVAFKPQTLETGAEWESFNNLGSVRWSAPEITFSDTMEIHWDDHTLLLESHPGPSNAAIWAVLPAEQIVFVGDAVVPSAPPFLSNADLESWMQILSDLQKPEYKRFTIVSGRGGVVTQNEVKNQQKTLEKVAKVIEKLNEKNSNQEEIEKAAHTILKNFETPKGKEQQYYLRLRYGLMQYLRRQFGTTLETSE
ncbi:MAG: hypothetical protein KBF64_07080 [Anaerolineaceae bacterium]|nr:hypothetical protein [Anaerolineaceae bacterium]